MSVADASSAILEVLKQEMPPLITAEQIGLCSPSDAADGFLLGLFIYNVTRDNKFQMNKNITIDSNVSQMPPVCVELSFMITPYIGKKSGLLDDYKLLDRVLQIWHDKAAIPFKSQLQPQFVSAPRVELLSPDSDAINKIWQFPGIAYRTSLFYKAAPIAIASTKQAVIPRVRDAELQAAEKDGAP